MMLQLVYRRRMPFPFQIGGGGDEQSAARCQAPSNKPAVADRAVPKDCVQAAGGRIDEAVVQLQRDFDLGMLLDEFGERRRQMEAYRSLTTDLARA
ncbi:hypothetical protein [Sinorhizobium sp. BJ1]|uniref:hypothetical protein n=1 Tax=Sinorhizobium sp. BJ1 TaxID=2035455 RepID=UPI001FE22EE9|nr:hypothetical protein [Sinorhizobium sp. BJ1]